MTFGQSYVQQTVVPCLSVDVEARRAFAYARLLNFPSRSWSLCLSLPPSDWVIDASAPTPRRIVKPGAQPRVSVAAGHRSSRA